MRMVFGGLISNMIQDAGINSSCVGINPISLNWDSMARHLLKYKDFLDGDFSKMDITIPAICYELLCTYLNNSYELEPEHRNMVDCLLKSVMSPLLIIGRCVYKTPVVNTSGQFLTCFINDYCCLVTRKASLLVHIITNYGYNDIGMVSDVCIKTFGDDHVISAAKEVRSIITPEQWATTVNTVFVMTITGITKVDHGTWYGSIEKVGFISREFRNIRNIWIGRLEDASFAKMMHWLKDSSEVTPHEVMQSIVDCAHYEAVVKGKTFFNKYTKAMYPVYREKKLTFKTGKWSQHWSEVMEKIIGDKYLNHGTFELTHI
jgi:hypothetical protein